MSSLIGQILLESWLVPFFLASVMIFPARWSDHRAVVVGLTAAAILAAVGTSYLLTFGWPDGASLGARQKIVLALVIGAFIGLAGTRNHAAMRPLLVVAVLASPIWIGWPALMQDGDRGWLLLLPVLVGFWLSRELTIRPSAATRTCFMLVTMAIGLALIAVYAKALSLAELGLALASTLLAIVLVGPRPPSGMATIMTAMMLLALLATLMLYSSAEPIALSILTLVLGAERLASLAHRSNNISDTPSPTFALLCLLPAMIAVVMARIDAGPFSIY